MNLREFRRRQAGLLVTPVAFDFVLDAKFFQQPQDAL
jgi:hypothetical protein